MGAFYAVAERDSTATPISIEANKGCTITVNITVNRYLLQWEWIRGWLRDIMNSRQCVMVMVMKISGAL